MRSEFDDALVARIYDAAIRPETWPDLMAELAKRVGGHSAWLSRLDVRTGNGTGIISRIDPAMPELYRQYYAGINPIAKVGDARRFIDQWQVGVLTDEDRMSKGELVRSEFYNDFLHPQDVHSTLMVRLDISGMTTTVLNIHRDARREQFQRAEIDDMERLVTHLVRALNLTDRLAASAAHTQDLTSIVDRSPDPMIVLAADGRLSHLNPAAAKLLADRSDLRLQDSVVRARHPRDDSVLRSLVGAAGATTGRRGGELRLAPQTGASTLLVSVTPVGPERLSIFQGGPSVLLHVAGFVVADEIPQAALASLFGLSPAEVRVAVSLLEHRTPAETAVALGLSIHTVRAHLARMFAKTDTRRQSELLGLLLKATSAAWR